MMYIVSMEKNMTDVEIRREIQKRKNKKALRRRLLVVCLAAIIAIVGGVLLGNKLGTNKYNSEIKIKTDVAEDTPMINDALAPLGNEGGEKFWSWYGFGSRVEWCACYVSWVENKQNYIDEGKAPQFAMVRDGADWFKDRDQWLKSGSTPAANDLIFFDWDNDDVLDHVGIVTAVVDNKVYTVEGNSSDRCRQKRYKLDDPVIAGYGHIAI